MGRLVRFVRPWLYGGCIVAVHQNAVRRALEVVELAAVQRAPEHPADQEYESDRERDEDVETAFHVFAPAKGRNAFSTTMKELAEKKAIDIGSFYADSSLFKSRTGWAPMVRLEEGFARTFEYYRAHFDRYEDVKCLTEQAGFEVVGEAETGAQAVEKYKQLKPDLVTMDITMKDKDGLQAAREVRQLFVSRGLQALQPGAKSRRGQAPLPALPLGQVEAVVHDDVRLVLSSQLEQVESPPGLLSLEILRAVVPPEDVHGTVI